MPLPHSSVDTIQFPSRCWLVKQQNHTCMFFTCLPACGLGDAALSLWIYYCLGNRPGTIICAVGNGADVWENHCLPRSCLSVRISVLLTEGGRVLAVSPDRVVFSWHWSASCPFLWLISLHFHPFLRFPITAQSQRFCINWKQSNWSTVDTLSKVIASVAQILISDRHVLMFVWGLWDKLLEKRIQNMDYWYFIVIQITV